LPGPCPVLQESAHLDRSDLRKPPLDRPRVGLERNGVIVRAVPKNEFVQGPRITPGLPAAGEEPGRQEGGSQEAGGARVRARRPRQARYTASISPAGGLNRLGAGRLGADVDRGAPRGGLDAK